MEVRCTDNIVEDIYVPLLTGSGFAAEPDNPRFGSMGTCWRMSEAIGRGYYWTYGQQNLFDIRIHDFCFHRDTFLEFHLPGLVSISWYESVSGEELSPYRRLSAGAVQSFIGTEEAYQVLIHKGIPIASVSIEIGPAYYEDYLKKAYPAEYINPIEAFRLIGQTDRFPEMIRLLKAVRDYRGDGIAAKLFYEGKVAEAVSLVVERYRANPPNPAASLSDADRKHLESVTAYIHDHFAYELPLERLSKIACMGATKFKSSFKQLHGCTVTEFIQERRMSQAEHLLSSTDLTIGQVAQTVGYQKASRFSELFRKSTGLLPGEYRKMTKKSPRK